MATFLDVQAYLIKLVHERPQRFTLVLANIDQGNGSSVMGSAGSELCFKLGHQRLKANSFQRGWEHSSQDCVVRGVQAHVHGVHVHVFVRVGRAVILVPVKVFPPSR